MVTPAARPRTVSAPVRANALANEETLAGPSAEMLAMWERLGEPRTREEEIAFSIEH